LWKCAEVGLPQQIYLSTLLFEMSQLLCVIRAPSAVSSCQCSFFFSLFFMFFLLLLLFYERLELPILFSPVLKSTVVKYFARAACRRAPTPYLG